MGTTQDQQFISHPGKMREQADGTMLLKSPVDPDFPMLGRKWGERLQNAKQDVRAWAHRHFPYIQETPTVILDRAGRPDTAVDRLYRIWERDDNHLHSPEFMIISEATSVSLMIGGLLGARKGVAGVKEKFIRIHAATIFANPQHAKRELLNALIRAGVSGAVATGSRIGLICFTMLSTATCVATVRGRSGIMEYGVAGAAAGFVYRLPMGPRAQLVASITGGILGSVLGSMVFAVMKASGTSMEQVMKERKKSMQDFMQAAVARKANVHQEAESIQAIYDHDDMWETVRSELEASGVIEPTDVMGQVPNKGLVMPSYVEKHQKPGDMVQGFMDRIVPIQLVLPPAANDASNERFQKLPT